MKANKRKLIVNEYILLTKPQGHARRISAGGLDYTNTAQVGS